MAVFGLLIVSASAWYTNDLASRIAVTEKAWVDIYRQALDEMNVESLDDLQNGEVDLASAIMLQMQDMEDTPQILIDNNSGELVDYVGFGGWVTDSAEAMVVLEGWIQDGILPVKIANQLQYIGESRLLRNLRYFPYIQGCLIGAFIIIGFIGINQARKAEQNRVWVGMAKETAHQLGTPISAILGWVEHLKMMYAEDGEIMEVADELARDVDRLSMVANRFSKIGATPELEAADVFEVLNHSRVYMEKRAPRKVSFDFPTTEDGEAYIGINRLLFDWVIENLLRNALDAMDGKGTISGAIRVLDEKVTIDITDTGKGIAPKNVRKVFVVEYHNGRIVVSRSELGVGTTFTITLPRVENPKPTPVITEPTLAAR